MNTEGEAGERQVCKNRVRCVRQQPRSRLSKFRKREKVLGKRLGRQFTVLN